MATSQIVIDTNVLVAGLRSKRGSAFRLLTLVGTGQFDLHLSIPLVLEYEEVLLADVPLVPVEPAIIEIVEAYIQRLVMPRDPTGDALHLALASFYKCDFLQTWNVRHLANANKFVHIRRVNTLLGLFTPTLITPLELLA